MDNKELVRKLKKENTLMKRLFTSKSKREENVRKLVQEHYNKLEGLFFVEDGCICRVESVVPTIGDDGTITLEMIFCAIVHTDIDGRVSTECIRCSRETSIEAGFRLHEIERDTAEKALIKQLNKVTEMFLGAKTPSSRNKGKNKKTAQ